MNELTVIPVPILPGGRINAFLVADGDSCILVDAGMPNSARRIGRALKKTDLRFRTFEPLLSPTPTWIIRAARQE